MTKTRLIHMMNKYDQIKGWNMTKKISRQWTLTIELDQTDNNDKH